MHPWLNLQHFCDHHLMPMLGDASAGLWHFWVPWPKGDLYSKHAVEVALSVLLESDSGSHPTATHHVVAHLIGICSIDAEWYNQHSTIGMNHCSPPVSLWLCVIKMNRPSVWAWSLGSLVPVMHVIVTEESVACFLDLNSDLNLYPKVSMISVMDGSYFCQWETPCKWGRRAVGALAAGHFITSITGLKLVMSMYGCPKSSS